MKIGICGGTFDPFHRGHLEPILAVRGALEWDRVVFVPARVQPFKREREAASGYHRFAMAVLATHRHEALLVSARELERGDVSYTVDTLEELRAENPAATLDWIIGDDNVAALLQWKSLSRIFELANFVVLTREEDGRVPQELSGRVRHGAERPAHGAIVFAQNAAVPVSATEVRLRVRTGQPVDDLVDPAVSRYIDRYALYRKGNP